MLVEGGLLLVGVWLYVTGTRGRDRIDTIALWTFITFVTLLYLGNLVGPPPPSARAIAVVGLASFVLPLWTAWVDKRRAA